MIKFAKSLIAMAVAAARMSIRPATLLLLTFVSTPVLAARIDSFTAFRLGTNGTCTAEAPNTEFLFEVTRRGLVADADGTRDYYVIVIVDGNNTVVSSREHQAAVGSTQSGVAQRAFINLAPVGADLTMLFVDTTSAGTPVGLQLGDGYDSRLTIIRTHNFNAASYDPDCSGAVDTTRPVVTALKNIAVNTAAGSNTAVVTWTAPTASDNVGVVSFTSSHEPGATFALGKTTVTYTALDAAGNSTSVSFDVTVGDNEVPSIAPPVDQIVGTDPGENTASLDVTGLGSAADNAEASLSITYRAGASILTGPYTFPLGDTIVTMDTTDATGNAAAQVSFTVTVNDEGAPVITPMAPVVLEAGPSVTINHAFSTTVIDNVDLDIMPVFTLNSNVITSPYDFPIGVSNVLVNAQDTAGNNAAQEVFVVTVTAAIAPSDPEITTSVINANRSMTIGGTAEEDSIVRVAFPDGSFQVVIATGGNYSVTSAADMLGGTVSVMATDSSGNQSNTITVDLFPDYAGPTVTIAGAPARVTDITPFSVTITFSEAVTGFDQGDISLTGGNITAFSGSDAVYVAEITPTAGETAMSLSIASGVAEDEFTNPNEASAVIEITNDALTETEEMIVKNAASRSRSLIAAQPQLKFFMLDDQPTRFDANVTQGAGSFDFATSDGRRAWAAGQGRWTSEGELESSYFNLALGAHLDVSENLLIGAMLQVDNFISDEGVARYEGFGWLAGPYAVARLAEQPLIFSASYLMGEADNKITPFGTYEDNFSSDRSLLTLGVAGEINLDRVTLIPLLDFAQAVEESEAYTDGDSNQVRSQKVTTTDATVGLDFIMPLSVDNGEFSLLGGVGITSSSVENAIETTEATIGSTELGFRYVMENGGAITGRANYDGLGQDDYEAFGAEVLFEINF